ncbi:MAG: 3-phosphoserine/phosphohydroxythreonine transaminase [Clostridiaceae bacterium]|jgi:phosphoserine aminotransferase|nr:3-phosphoserine/phosphohydroxythreonine transaminase [Clostridiaceae bacterium]
MKRVYNFSAGPSVLPEPVLKKAADEMLCYKDSGMSVMEMSHRSKVYESIIQGAEALLRELIDIPDNYKVLFLQGGASSQFAMIPLNLIGKTGRADYVITGQWAKKAAEEAARYGEVNIVASSADKVFNYIPDLNSDNFDRGASYFHITSNNTIYGTRYTTLPDTGDVPLVSDMSSCILSEKVDVSKFGLIYAGAQKNMGPAGVTVVIIRDDLIGNSFDITPTMFKYDIHAKNNSLYNTPPTYSIYVLKLVLEWLKELGGVSVMQSINEQKAKVLYDYLDEGKMFKGTVVKKDRSLMNIPFITESEDLNAKFISEAKAAGFENLKGHRTVGGMRASIYNAMPLQGVLDLVDFMKKFERENKNV